MTGRSDLKGQPAGLGYVSAVDVQPQVGGGIPTRLYLSENLGESRLLNLELGDVLVKARVAEAGPYADGDTVPVAFEPDSIHLFDADTGHRVEPS